MKISNDGINLLGKLEGSIKDGDFHMPYNDETGKIIKEYCFGATIGYGHKIFNDDDFEKYIDGINEDDAVSLLRVDSTKFSLNCERYITSDISQNKFDACVILSFNIGNKGFKNSSVLKLINNTHAKTDYDSLESAWKAWNKGTIDGKRVVIDGLKNRRKKEWDLYNDKGYEQIV